jgi:hypothetical protein
LEIAWGNIHQRTSGLNWNTPDLCHPDCECSKPNTRIPLILPELWTFIAKSPNHTVSLSLSPGPLSSVELIFHWDCDCPKRITLWQSTVASWKSPINGGFSIAMLICRIGASDFHRTIFNFRPHTSVSFRLDTHVFLQFWAQIITNPSTIPWTSSENLLKISEHHLKFQRTNFFFSHITSKSPDLVDHLKLPWKSMKILWLFGPSSICGGTRSPMATTGDSESQVPGP